jgi:hypothetical protein
LSPAFTGITLAADFEARMIRRLPFLAVALAASPALAADLPYFAGGEAPGRVASPVYYDGPAVTESPWAGWSVSAGVVGVSGGGRGTHGGFGAQTSIAYAREFDNHVVVGVSGTFGTLPGFYNCGPNGYNYGMANVSVGYNMGNFLPYVTASVGTVKANGYSTPLGGLNSANTLFSRGGASTTVTSVGAGFDYMVNNNLRVGVQVNAMQARGGTGFGPAMIPQPGQLR